MSDLFILTAVAGWEWLAVAVVAAIAVICATAYATWRRDRRQLRR